MFLVDLFNIAIASPRISTIVGLIGGIIIGWNLKALTKNRDNPIEIYDLTEKEAKDLHTHAVNLKLSRGAKEMYEKG